jgi:hypothetical protein
MIFMPLHDAQASSEASQEGEPDDALRRYMREQAWEELNAYGRARAKELGIIEEDVVPLLRQYRREEREKRASAQPVK